MPVNSFDNYYMSWKPNIKNINEPIYKALVKIMEEDINSGKLQPGTKLPPQRELADFLDINLSTVSRAFKICMEKGFLSSSIGSGTFVASDAGFSNLISSDPNNKEIVEMGAILPDVKNNKLLIKYMKNIINEPRSENFLQYGLPDGTRWHKQSAKKWLERYHLNVDEEKVLFATGGQNAITSTLAALFKSGDKIGTSKFIYPGLKTAAKMLGIQVVPIEEEDYEITKEGLIYACKNEKIKGLYLIPDYSNPTTHTISEKGRKDIAKVAKDWNLIVIEDAINSILMNKVPKPIYSFAEDNTIFISSISKTITPGLRISFLLAPELYYERIKTALYNINIAVPPLMLEVASRIIQSDDVNKILNGRKKEIVKRNKLLNTYLSEYKIYGDINCPFRWLILPDYFTGRSFELCAKEYGVIVFSAERFAVGNSKMVNAVRIAVTSANSLDEFERGVKILKGILEDKSEVTLL